jgi:hypothetical protein
MKSASVVVCWVGVCETVACNVHRQIAGWLDSGLKTMWHGLIWGTWRKPQNLWECFASWPRCDIPSREAWELRTRTRYSKGRSAFQPVVRLICQPVRRLMSISELWIIIFAAWRAQFQLWDLVKSKGMSCQSRASCSVIRLAKESVNRSVV